MVACCQTAAQIAVVCQHAVRMCLQTSKLKIQESTSCKFTLLENGFLVSPHVKKDDCTFMYVFSYSYNCD